MKLFTDEILARMEFNDVCREEADYDPKPVVKIFNPCGAATWLLTEIDGDGRCFGLCDLGMGFPELGSVMREELEGYRGPLGIGLERDILFTPTKTLSEYAEEARESGGIRT